MDDTITTTYYLCDEFLKAIGHHDDPQQLRLSTAEVMTIPLVACAFFCGNLEASRSFLDQYGYTAFLTPEAEHPLPAVLPQHELLVLCRVTSAQRVLGNEWAK